MKRKVLYLFVLLCHVVLVISQTNANKKLSVYESKTNMFYGVATCYFIPGKYTLEQLENTERLCNGATGSHISLSFENLRSDGMNFGAFIQKVKVHLKDCPLVEGVFWENLRKECLNVLEYEYEMHVLRDKVSKDIMALKDSKFSQYCQEYVKALTGTEDELMQGWKELVQKQAKSNADPERIMKQFRENAASENWVENARSELMNYGWGNCINDLAHKGTFYKIIDQSEVSSGFYKLFEKVDEEMP